MIRKELLWSAAPILIGLIDVMSQSRFLFRIFFFLVLFIAINVILCHLWKKKVVFCWGWPVWNKNMFPRFLELKKIDKLEINHAKDVAVFQKPSDFKQSVYFNKFFCANE